MPPVAADVLFWAAVVCCAVAELFIVRSTLAARNPQSGQQLPPGRRAAEVAWAIVPAVALALVLAATWRAMHPALQPAPGTLAPVAEERASARATAREGLLT